MKRGDIQELKNKSKEELKSLLEESKKKLQELRFDIAEGKVTRVQNIGDTRKYIARIHTFLKTK